MILEVVNFDNADTKDKTEWKKVYKVSLKGKVGDTVSAALTLKSENLLDLEAIVPLIRDTKRRIDIKPVDQSLADFTSSSDPGSTNLISEGDDDDNLRDLRQERYDKQDDKQDD